VLHDIAYMNQTADFVHTESTEQAYVSSRYNFHVPIEGGALLYNSSSGAVMKLVDESGLKLAEILSTKFVTLLGDEVSEEVWAALTQGGFIVPSGFNEVDVIKERFSKARRTAPIFLTLTTTQDCNLGCYYCYEERTKSRLGEMDLASILSWILNKFTDRSGGDRYLHVDWYGGEPLLNIDFIEAASPAIQQLCAENHIDYTASIISNGTLWPEDVAAFAKRHKIQQAQISFDGLRENHNQRRRYRAGFKRDGDSSFDLAVRVVDGLLSACRVDVRLNLDRGNYSDLSPFVDFAKARGWFDREYPCVMMPARLSYYTAHSAFMRKVELDHGHLDEMRAFMKQAGAEGRLTVDEQDPEVQDFAYPRASVCAALAHNSQVVGAEGLIYKCGLLVGDRDKAVGRLANDQTDSEEQFPAAKWWESYDPTTLPNCSRCSFLPVCWGGCPLKHLNQDTHALEERSIYWRNHLPHLITRRFGEEPPAGFSFTEADQFR
jgi:uncharacterized protein